MQELVERWDAESLNGGTCDVAAPRSSNPYVGPQPLGRRASVCSRASVERPTISDLLVAERVVLLYSPSGAGKTSLVHAGLVKRLREREEFRVLPVMRVNLARAALKGATGATNKYVRSALEYLESGLPEAKRMPAADLSSIRLKDYLDRRPRDRDDGPEGSDYEVLIFDQFEEIITLDPTDREAKAEFFRQVGEALRDHNRWALFVMREDHVAEIDEYSHLVPTALATRFRLSLLNQVQAGQAIRGPTEAARHPFADDVVERLVGDLATVTVQDGSDVHEATGEYVEPVQLQVVCRRLWDRHVKQAINVGDLGGSSAVNEALQQFYVDVVTTTVRETGVRERELRDWIENELIIAGVFRGQVIRTPGTTRGLANATIDGLTQGHLLRSERRGGREWIEITHDRLVQPIRDSNERWRKANLTLFQQQAEVWNTHGRAVGLLLPGTELDDAESWAASHAADLEDHERDYLADCRAARERARQIEEKNRQIVEQNRLLAESNREIEAQSTRARRYGRFWLMTAIVMLGLGAVAWVLYVRTLYLEEESQRVQVLTQIRQLLATARELPQVQYGKTLTLALYADELLKNARAKTPEDADLERERLATRFTLIAGLLSAPPVTRTFLGHGASIRHVAWSPDGKLLASASFDKTIIVWNVEKDTSQRLTGHEDFVYCVEFSPDGSLLASADAGGRIRLWQLSGTEAHPVGPDNMNVGQGANDAHKGKVTSLAFAPDGRSLASGGWDGQVIVWDVSTPAAPRMLASSRLRVNKNERHRSVVYAVAFVGPNRIAAGDWKGEVRFWSWDPQQAAGGNVAPLDSTRRLLFAGEEDAGAVNGIAYDPGHDRLAVNGWTKIDKKSDELQSRVAVWENVSTDPRPVDAAGGPRKSDFPGFGIAFAADGALASVGGIDRTLTLRQADAVGGRPDVVRFQERLYSVAFSPQNPTMLAIGGARTLMLVDTRHTGSLLTQTLELSLDTPVPGAQWEHVAITPDANTVVATTDGRLIVWNARGKRRSLYAQRASFDSGAPALAAVAVNRTGTLIATASLTGGKVRIWSADGAVQGELDWDEKPLSAEKDNPPRYRLLFSPVDEYLLAVAYRRSVRLYNLVDPHRPALVGTPSAEHNAAIRALAFQPSGAQLASADADSRIRLWSVSASDGLAPGTVELRLPTDAAAALAYAPDGRLLAAGSFDSDISVLDTKGERPTVVLTDHDIAIANLAFGGDAGRDAMMLSMDRDGRGFLWEVRGGNFRRLVRPFSPTSGTGIPIALAADGDLLVTGGSFPRMWDLRMETLVRLACQVRHDELNEVEKEAYGVKGRNDSCGPPETP